jgi:RNA polymerase primary sigma factor
MNKSSSSDPTLEKYYLELSTVSILTPEEEVLYFNNYRATNCSESREKIIKSCIKLVFRHAKQYWKDGNVETLKSLISAGNVGLLESLDRYDIARGTKFSSYASFWILMHIRNELTDLHDLVRASSRDRKERMLINKHREKPDDNSPESPTTKGYSKKYCRDLTKVDKAAYSTSPEYSVSSPEETYEDTRTVIEVRNLFLRWVRFLRLREQKIIIQYYGLYDSPQRSFREIAQEVNLSSEMVRQIKEKAMKKLKRWMLYDNISELSHILD